LTTSERPWDLAATCRCLTEDLSLSSTSCRNPIEQLSEIRVIRTFLELRGLSPKGSETIQALQPKLTAYSLHSGRYRGATWHDRKAAICWLLAVGIHSEDSRGDAYAHFHNLQRTSRLLPTVNDVRHVLERRQPSFETVLLEEIPLLRGRAMEHPGRLFEAVPGSRVAVRVVYENGHTGILWVAISSRLTPGERTLPEGWYELLLAAFLPDSESLDMAFDLAGQPLRVDEAAFCCFVAQPE
jgi:hypothetical protein